LAQQAISVGHSRSSVSIRDKISKLGFRHLRKMRLCSITRSMLHWNCYTQ